LIIRAARHSCAAQYATRQNRTPANDSACWWLCRLWGDSSEQRFLSCYEKSRSFSLLRPFLAQHQFRPTPWHSEVAATGEVAVVVTEEAAVGTVEGSVVATWADSEAVASPEAALAAVQPLGAASQRRGLPVEA
jgi:hypothetical protein